MHFSHGEMKTQHCLYIRYGEMEVLIMYSSTQSYLNVLLWRLNVCVCGGGDPKGYHMSD